jgi:Zn-dependent peptidase ImmA (M78 family)/transcriptional regulator with XRE-family HTH domain
MPKVNPELVALARESRGITQKDLATLLDVSQSRISKIEDDIASDISDDEVNRLAAALAFPVSFFFRHDSLRNTTCVSLYRKRVTVPAKLLRACDAKIKLKSLHVQKLVESADLGDDKLPIIKPDEFEGGASSIAQMLRSYWSIPSGPINNLVQVIENAGCIVIPFDFGTSKLDGLSFLTKSNIPIIFINPKLPSDRIRLTLAHELGHVVMHRKPTEDMESEAYEFAAEFLMPAREIKSSFYPLNLDTLARLKLHWKVSMQALLKRAEQLGCIKPSYATYIWIQMSKLGYKTSEPHEDLIPKEQPSLLQELVEMHLDQLEYSPDSLAEALGLKRAEFDSEYRSSHGALRLFK